VYKAVNLPLVLHGGSGIQIEFIRKGIKAGIAKINIGTEIRQTYERAIQSNNNIDEAREAVYKRVRELIADLQVKNTHSLLYGEK
jgi:fructose/tagatose bisphosphate aldolase